MNHQRPRRDPEPPLIVITASPFESLRKQSSTHGTVASSIPNRSRTSAYNFTYARLNSSPSALRFARVLFPTGGISGSPYATHNRPDLVGNHGRTRFNAGVPSIKHGTIGTPARIAIEQ